MAPLRALVSSVFLLWRYAVGEGSGRELDDVTHVIRGSGSSLLPVGPVRRDRCSLTLITGPMPGAVFPVGDAVVIGRGMDTAIRIDDEGLSRRHARVFRLEEVFFVEDLASTNGTFVNGDRVLGRRQVSDGERIRVGKCTTLRVALQDDVEQEVATSVYDAATHDGLTRLCNRHLLDEKLAHELARAVRSEAPLTLLLLDIDHFKDVNDRYGHVAGDEVMRALGRLLLAAAGPENTAARYGGDELCIVARGLDARGAFVMAERLRARIRSHCVAWKEVTISVTASIGVATRIPVGSYPDCGALIAAADEALCRAKQGGRDRCIAAPAPHASYPAAGPQLL